MTGTFQKSSFSVFTPLMRTNIFDVQNRYRWHLFCLAPNAGPFLSQSSIGPQTLDQRRWSIAMNATEARKSQSEAVEKIMREHDALRDKVSRIHNVLAEPEPDQFAIDTILREFLNALIVHFSNEEDDGFFDEITTCAPHLSSAAGRLCVEHQQMLHDVQELCRFAVAGSPSMPWWRELRTRCHSFNRRLMQHECEENRLLHEAHAADIGVCD